MVSVANSTNCMRPFSVADRWIQTLGTVDHYDHWDKVGNDAVELDPHDIYNPGLGWTIPGDIGAEQILKGGNNPNSDSDEIHSRLDRCRFVCRTAAGGYVSGGDDYRDAIGHCIGNPVTIGDYLPLENGVMNGPTNQGIDDLIALDPDATFNTTTKMVEGSCAPGCGPQSPRIVPIAVFDIEEFNYRRAAGDWTACPGGGKCVQVVKILGYFVSHMSGGDVVGYLMTLPGEFVAGGGMPPGDSFLSTSAWFGRDHMP